MLTIGLAETRHHYFACMQAEAGSVNSCSPLVVYSAVIRTATKAMLTSTIIICTTREYRTSTNIPVDCSLCTGTIEKALGRMPSVDKVVVSLTHESLTHEQALVEYDPAVARNNCCKLCATSAMRSPTPASSGRSKKSAIWCAKPGASSSPWFSAPDQQ